MVVVRILWPAEASGGFMISSNGIGKTTIVRTLQIVQRENQWTLIVYSPSPRAPRSRSPVHTAGAGCSTGRTAGPLDKHQGQAAGYFGGSCLRSGGSSQAGRTVFAGDSPARSATVFEHASQSGFEFYLLPSFVHVCPRHASRTQAVETVEKGKKQAKHNHTRLLEYEEPTLVANSDSGFSTVSLGSVLRL
jgi:hypothetical protein